MVCNFLWKGASFFSLAIGGRVETEREAGEGAREPKRKSRDVSKPPLDWELFSALFPSGTTFTVIHRERRKEKRLFDGKEGKSHTFRKFFSA